jgi:hypothetical protein
MSYITSSLGLTYLATCGLAANACVVGRGLVRAAGQAGAGNFGLAGETALAAVAAPAVLTYNAANNLVGDVLDGASALIGDLLVRGPEGQDWEPAFTPFRKCEAVVY